MALRSELHTISICTGGAGLDLGLELAVPGARAVCMVEREAFGAARLVSAMEDGLLAPAAVWSNARTFAGRRWRGCVDGLIGGIPCQPHSVAGKRRGQADERDLWSIARRIAVQSGVWFVLIENVGGMLSSSDPYLRAGAERVWRDLQRLGFQVEGGLFTAAEVGAPHERERVFILGVADARSSGHQGTERSAAYGTVVGIASSGSTAELCGAHLGDTFRGDSGRWPEEPVGRQDRGTFVGRSGRVHVWPPRPNDIDGWRDLLATSPEAEPAVCGNAHGLASRLDQLRMLGNGVVPLEAAHAIRTLAHRLAARGAPAAAELVRMMGGDR